MAARGSSSSGMIVLTSVLGLTTLGFFITSVYFFASARAATEDSKRASEASKEYVTSADMNNPVLQRLKAGAKGKSVISFMLDQQSQIMRRTLGAPTGTLEQLEQELKAISPDSGESASAVSVLKDFKQQLGAAATQLKDAEAAKTRALQDKEATTKLMTKLQDESRQSVAKLTADVDQTKAGADQLRQDVDKFKGEMDARVDRIRQEYAAKESALQAEIDKLQRDRVIDKGRLAVLEKETKGARFTGQSEYSLVDGRVVGINSADNTLVLGMGRKQRVTLGLTFEVYADATAIRPDASGEYPRGKASVEIIRVDQDSSVARVLREQKGNPVVTGDVVANALYDPAKIYKFLVFGNFDPARSGTSTPLGASDVKARITSWGGQVVDTLTGDVDFIVLGARPAVTPEPSPTAPIEYINEHLRLRAEAKKYDELFQQAVTTSIPVLNENRLYTLTGG